LTPVDAHLFSLTSLFIELIDLRGGVLEPDESVDPMLWTLVRKDNPAIRFMQNADVPFYALSRESALEFMEHMPHLKPDYEPAELGLMHYERAA